jgi:hypothetical protein
VVAQRFQQAVDEGDLPSDADTAALACYLMTLNSGLAVQAKSGVGKKQLLKVVELAMRGWPFWEGQGQLRPRTKLVCSIRRCAEAFLILTPYRMKSPKSLPDTFRASPPAPMNVRYRG